jgi:hypothetical protein
MQKISYKAELAGIEVVFTEESYTSKISGPFMPHMFIRSGASAFALTFKPLSVNGPDR